MVSNLKNKTAGKRNSSTQGFSLIELLIVVAVILIIVAIAIPNFVQSKMRANESSSVQNLRNITTAEVIYATTYSVGFSPDLTSLGGNGTLVTATNAQLIDEILAAGKKSGYQYTYVVLTMDSFGNATGYSINADPLVPTYTGMRHFYSDQTAVIRENDTAPASSSDNPLQ